MPEQERSSQTLTRVPTGVEGLDSILGGGLFKGGIYIAMGTPGAGKTILANQLCFRAVRHGRRSLYVTLLAETHARMLTQIRSLSFFDEAALGTQVKYLNGYRAIDEGGLAGLLTLLRASVREHEADLLILDGMVTVSTLAKSPIDYTKFINELQTWSGMFGCTVLFLASTHRDEASAEFTMVDGIFDLSMERKGPRSLRRLTVTKFRGSGFSEGSHAYSISDDGIRVFPRLETRRFDSDSRLNYGDRLTSGVHGLDEILEGGVPLASSTLLLGSSGAGKTIMGMQFLAAGYRQEEPVIHFGFFEGPQALAAKGDRLGLGMSDAVESGHLKIIWRHPVDKILDAMGERLLREVDAHKAKRVFIDGLVGFKQAWDQERLTPFFAAVVDELTHRGVTLMITEETRELFIREVEIPTAGASALFHNILFLRQVEREGALTRLFTVMKVRDSGFDRRLFEFDITKKGIKILGPFSNPEAGMAGDASVRTGTKAPRKRSILSRRK